MNDQLIPRRTQLWLLIVNLAVLLPLSHHATTWSLGIFAICWVWRMGIYFGKVAKPPRLLVSGLALAAAATLALVAKQIGALNALMNLLILGYGLKFIEIRRQRDIHAIVLVGFFLVALSFIDNQSIGAGVMMLIIVTLNITTLMSLYISQIHPSIALFAISKWLLISAPLALVLFLIIPRLPPLWLTPQLGGATTGLSDSMALADINQLTRSDSLAFNVSFDGAIPPPAELYWRAIVLEQFDGERWTQRPDVKSAEQSLLSPPDPRVYPGGGKQYQVIMEPSYQSWLVSLDTGFSRSDEAYNTFQYRLLASKKVVQKLAYRVRSVSQYVMDEQLTPLQLTSNLALPAQRNPQTLALANKFRQQYPDPQARLSAIMQHFQIEPYYYTLTPPRLGPAQIDDFLFTHKRGFCGHYASALVYLARASGMPARIVSGYQGGEISADNSFVSVYQYMAHAWAEVWIAKQGWVRADPTAMIAPQRVEDGFDAVFSPQQSYLADSHLLAQRLQQQAWFIRLQEELRRVDYYWSQWVLGYNTDKQQQLLTQLLGDISPLKLALMIFTGFATMAVLIFVLPHIAFRNRRHDPLARRYRKLMQQLTQWHGLSTTATPSQVHQCIGEHYPQLQAASLALYHSFIEARYQPSNNEASSQWEKICRRLLWQLHWRLKFLHLLGPSK
ncbi:DUF3488 and transglutaminase-like domain-containing protein [Shewanella sp. NIFS-20-20]|uniref:transglutaminase family protein n=1 Tax=Shewanella sp. NIFS-20-20 TaxID=2853806 RepID=UPI001C488D9D|nr:DUF3488 and transglutaminase-like domain-containing protein [Shewanella sp. NIFS-20-20]MBV7315077.1 DUF3488 and transglutaminase-like domain-containing protein [Shewanella sp. NIFS-20-20]